MGKTYNEAQKKASRKYEAERKRITLVLPAEKAEIIKKRALAENFESAQEYILNLIDSENKYYEDTEFFAIVVRKGQEIGRKSLGTYPVLADPKKRISTTLYKKMLNEAVKYFDTFKAMPQQEIHIEYDGKTISQGHPFSEWVE